MINHIVGDTYIKHSFKEMHPEKFIPTPPGHSMIIFYFTYFLSPICFMQCPFQFPMGCSTLLHLGLDFPVRASHNLTLRLWIRTSKKALIIFLAKLSSFGLVETARQLKNICSLLLRDTHFIRRIFIHISSVSKTWSCTVCMSPPMTHGPEGYVLAQYNK